MLFKNEHRTEKQDLGFVVYFHYIPIGIVVVSRVLQLLVVFVGVVGCPVFPVFTACRDDPVV